MCSAACVRCCTNLHSVISPSLVLNLPRRAPDQFQEYLLGLIFGGTGPRNVVLSVATDCRKLVIDARSPESE